MDVRLSNLFYLALLAAIGALLLSSTTAGSIRTASQSIFYPITGPMRMAVTPATPTQTIATQGPKNDAAVQAMVAENEALRNQLAIYVGQIETLRQRVAEDDLLGQALAEISTRVRVTSADKSQTLQIAAGSDAAINSPVVLPQRLIGRVSNVGLAGRGASVQLITHPGFKCTVGFGRKLESQPGQAARFGIINLGPVVAQGKDDGEMRIDTLRLTDVEAAGLKIGDTVILRDQDPAWGAALQNIHLGVVSEIKPRANANGFAEIRVRPEIELLGLREVLVVRGAR